MNKLKIGLIICLLVSYYFMLWQFDHTVAPVFWDDPLMHGKIIDGWFLGYISGIDVYNTCMMFLILLPVSIVIVGLIPFQKIQWHFNSSGHLDPPKRKVIFGFIVIILSDLSVGIQTLTEGMSKFALTQTVLLIVIHALILGFMFLEKSTSKP